MVNGGRITVLLAAYEGARWLPEQLRSLRAQTDPDFAVLMQDDGSADETPAILARAAAGDPRFSLAAEPGRHFGARGNFFSLLRQAPEGLTALCDQDDLWMPERLAACRAAMEAAEARWGRETPLLVHSDCSVVDASGSRVHASLFRHQGWRGDAASLTELLVQNNVTGCTVLINAPLRRLAAGCANPEQQFMHDWFLAQTAAAFGKIVWLSEPLVAYRQHGDNAVGASAGGRLRRGVTALRRADEARERIRLTYRQAEAFAAAFPDALPQAAAVTVRRYLDTRGMPWPRRPLTALREGFRMQSPLTRAGQFLFG